MLEEKRCSTCGKLLPLTEYSDRKKSPDGLSYSCKMCQREQARISYRRRKFVGLTNTNKKI